ncbi:hypothetical protein AB0454_43260 [Streptomyces sp. NPDC093509]|uniref:DUF6924 domain-containing protein n=1 Tax=Streptomyces sp. NPDC093509 TaxID=3154982 RepID=UPI00344B5405
MRAFLNSGDRNEFDPVVIRSDYSDEQAWQSIRATLTENAEVGSTAWIVDDPVWLGAGADEVLAVVSADESFKRDLPIFFLADFTAMQAKPHALLAITAATRRDFANRKEYLQVTAFGRQFRIVPHAVHSVHGNLNIASMDFEEFAAAAHRDREGIYRCCCRSF